MPSTIGDEPPDNRMLLDLQELVRDLAKSIHFQHSGSCCTYDTAGGVIVTRYSCKCTDLVKRVHDAAGTWESAIR
jgi:hypothetical protein